MPTGPVDEATDDMAEYAEPCTVNGTSVMLDGVYHLADDVLRAAGLDPERTHLYEDPDADTDRRIVTDPLVDVCFASSDVRSFLAVPVDEPAPTDASASTGHGRVDTPDEDAHPRGDAYSARRADRDGGGGGE